MLRTLLIVIALIIYGCLYPFRFHGMPTDPWHVFWHWPTPVDRFVLRDAVLNVVMYLPFGGLAFLSMRRARNRWIRVLWPLAAALTLSTAIEFVQLMDLPRTSSVFDVVCNLTGAAAGIAAARMYSARLLEVAARTRHRLAPAPGPALLLLCLWLGYQLFPLFPSIGLYALRMKLRMLVTQPYFSAPEAALATVEWLILAAVLKQSAPGAASRQWLGFLLLLLPARFFLLGRNLTLSELIGALSAWILWCRWMERTPRAPFLLAFLTTAALIHLELSPYRFSTTAHPFSWLPLAGFIESGPDWGAVVFLRKTFWYGTVLWSLRQVSAGYCKPALTIALLLGILEWAQRYVPGRTPEITDPLLAVLLAVFLYFFEHYPEKAADRDQSALHESKLV